MIPDLLSQSGLSLERLRAFCLIAEAGGITKAAGGDSSKQPLFSRQLKELETFFGTELVRRAGRGVVLTEAGRKLHRVAGDYFGALADFKNVCQKEPVHLKIGAGDSLIQWLLLPKLGLVRRKLPGVRLALLNLPTQEIVEKLEEGQLDLGIVRKDSLSPRLRGWSLGKLEFALYVSKRLLRSGAPKWEDVLARAPLALLEGAGAYRHELESSAAKAGIILRIEIECSSFPAVAKAVQSADAAAILPMLAEQEFREAQIARVPVPWMNRLSRDMSLVLNPRVAQVRDAIADAAHVLADIWKMP